MDDGGDVVIVMVMMVTVKAVMMVMVKVVVMMLVMMKVVVIMIMCPWTSPFPGFPKCRMGTATATLACPPRWAVRSAGRWCGFEGICPAHPECQALG